MASKVMIKSYKNGLKVFLNAEDSFDEITASVENTFAESRKFFEGSIIAVSFEGRELTSPEERILVNIMEEFGGLRVVYIVGQDTETKEIFQKAMDHLGNLSEDNSSFGMLYCDTIKKGEHITTESGAVILGDVQPGGSIIASGSIVVLGGIYGTAVCDATDNAERYFIAGMDVSAEKIKIGGIKYTAKEKAKWVIKPKMQAKIAYINEGQIELEPISSKLLTELCNKFKAE